MTPQENARYTTMHGAIVLKDRGFLAQANSMDGATQIADALNETTRLQARVEQLERERKELRDALRDIAVATPVWSENVGNLAGGETWHGFSQRLKQRAFSALESELTS